MFRTISIQKVPVRSWYFDFAFKLFFSVFPFSRSSRQKMATFDAYVKRQVKKKKKKLAKDHINAVLRTALKTREGLHKCCASHRIKNCYYLSRYVDNQWTSQKQDELTRYLRFEHCKTNRNNILDFWKTMMTEFLSSLTKVSSQILIVSIKSSSVFNAHI